MKFPFWATGDGGDARSPLRHRAAVSGAAVTCWRDGEGSHGGDIGGDSGDADSIGSEGHVAARADAFAEEVKR